MPGSVVNSERFVLTARDLLYPKALSRCLADGAPETIWVRGNVDILRCNKVALFSSRRCPGNAILGTYDLARALRDASVCVIGGFHSSMEKECLDLLLRGVQPVVVCPARTIDPMRIPADWKTPLAEGRLLLLSPFDSKYRRATAALARQRNEFVAALADEIIIACAEPGGKTEAMARQALEWGKPTVTFDIEDNEHLVEQGVTPMSVDEILAAAQERQ